MSYHLQMTFKGFPEAMRLLFSLPLFVWIPAPVDVEDLRVWLLDEGADNLHDAVRRGHVGVLDEGALDLDPV
jgi:hypothetical protein